MTHIPAAHRDPSAYAGALAHSGVGLFFLGLAIYGSLVPFHFQPIPLRDAFERWHKVQWLPIGIERRSDFVANILLFIPLGYFFVAALCVDRPRSVFLPAAILIVPLLCGLAVAIEFTQIWFPPRTVSLNDIVAESIGGAIGAGIWLAFGNRITVRIRALLAALGRREISTQLLPVYLAFLVLIHVMPLDLTISPVEIWHKYKQGRIVLIPFATPVSGPEMACKVLWNTVYFFPVGLLLAGMRTRRPLGAAGVLLIGLVTAGGICFLKLFVWTRFADVTDVLTGTAAIVAGWAVRNRAAARGISFSRLRVRTAAFAIWVVVLMLINWYPFDFLVDGTDWLQRFWTVSPIPFEDLYHGSEYHAFDQVLHKTLLFMPVGALLSRPGCSTLPAFFAGMFLSLILEAGQLGLLTRYTSVTDVLVETSAAWLGCLLARRLQVMLNSPAAPGPASGRWLPAGTRS